ncbi:MAG: GTPase Era [Clostridia bacterium]|nr:GTPase Era [Clostridia bacterium]
MTRTGFIAIVGRPNVGKSTLLNSILGEKVAIVSKKPQTTRNRITGIHTVGEDQFVFLDTPGIHRPRTRLGDFMVKAAGDTLGEADAAILVIEPRDTVGDIEAGVIEKLRTLGLPAILAVNKIDATSKEHIAKTIASYAEAFDFDAVVPMSAKNGKGVDILLDECKRYLSESEFFFPSDALTDQPERQIASEIIREKLLRVLDEEIPHGTAVVVEDFREEEKMISIRAEIFCERPSHKGIIIGKHGATLKTIGTYAREDMERFFGIKVFLDLWVKVKDNWRDSLAAVRNFGYHEE